MRRPSRIRLVGAMALALMLSTAAHAGSTRAFEPGSLEHILQARQERPFVLVLWSLGCAPCLNELKVLAAELRQHPDTDLVLVSTDAPAARQRVERTLAQQGLEGRVESWIFADVSEHRLRHDIDPAWYGELPRAYFYDANHRRQASSGGLTPAHFQGWRAAAGDASRLKPPRSLHEPRRTEAGASDLVGGCA